MQSLEFTPDIQRCMPSTFTMGKTGMMASQAVQEKSVWPEMHEFSEMAMIVENALVPAIQSLRL